MKNKMKNIKIIVDGKEVEAQVDWDKLQEIMEVKGWPQEGDCNYYITHSGAVGRDVSYDPDYHGDQGRLKIGNVFRSKQDAKDVVRALNLIQAVKERRSKLRTEGFAVARDGGYGIALNCDKELWPCGLTSSMAPIFGLYSDDDEAMAVVEEFRDELEWFFNDFYPRFNRGEL